ncbi:MAG: alginate O-acetyltransferase AlgX-related protein [Spirochaetia bacterium]
MNEKISEAPFPNLYGKRKWIFLIPFILMNSILLTGLILSFMNPGFRNPPDTDLRPLLQGEWTTAYQNKYEEELPIRDFARNVWGFIRFVLFREGENGIVVGAENWLYTAEEFTIYDGGKNRLEKTITYITEVRQELINLGVHLVIAPVPAKVRVYPEHLGRRGMPEELETRYRSFLAKLNESDIEVSNILSALLREKSSSQVFLRTDTHWTPAGASAAAEKISETVIPLLEQESVSRGDIIREQGDIVTYRGDLFNFLPLGAFQDTVGPAPDRIETFEYIKKNGPNQSLFGEIITPVALTGTSYSAGELWDFSGALEAALDVDVINMATEGDGPFIPMQTFIQELKSRDDLNPEVVIWEIPERYIADPEMIPDTFTGQF